MQSDGLWLAKLSVYAVRTFIGTVMEPRCDALDRYLGVDPPSPRVYRGPHPQSAGSLHIRSRLTVAQRLDEGGGELAAHPSAIVHRHVSRKTWPSE